MQLGPIAHRTGFQLTHVATIGSTNAELLTHASKPNAANLWLVAECQTSGHGRRARNWASPTGNLYASVLLQQPCPTQHLSDLPFIAALALYDAIEAEQGQLALKWPNDLMLTGKKLSGILVEACAIKASNPTAYNAVIGFGVNIISHPEASNHPATNLRAQAIDQSRQNLFAALGDTLVNWLDIWQQGNNFAEIRKAWLARAFNLNQKTRVNLPDKSLEGLFTGLDETGALLLQLDDGSVKPIRTGDVFALPQ